MDIKIIDSWLREFIKTPATPEEIARNLSLTSQSVEKISKIDNDTVYDIEVTSNRPDAFSVYGIARELSAILPRFNIKAKLLPIPGTEKEIPKVKTGLPLKVKISQKSLVPRFTALIFNNISIKPSPKYVQKRLETSGIRSLNNVIDISNYLMLELGQPMHTFDYDKILGAEMIVREAKEGEKIITLDNQERLLPPGTIVIEDGKGRIIDLCGIMGGKNSEVDENTKKVLLFIQTYDPTRIRKTCQSLGFRTEAASRFEKGVDPEGVILAMKRAISLFRDWAGGEVASKLFDIYENPPKEKTIALEKFKLNRLMGIEIDLKEAKKILENLGFESKIINNKSLIAKVPHWRIGDVSIPEDLIEEIARLYGYFKLPNNLPPISAPKQSDYIFEFSLRLKNALKFWGFTETPTYSMTSASTLKKVGINPEALLKISNPLSEDLIYMRLSLLPSLLEVLVKNINLPEIKIFEIDNIYLPQTKSELPDEKPMLSGLIYPGEYLKAKGVVEGILNELGISKIDFIPPKEDNIIFEPFKTADLFAGKNKIGRVGEINLLVLKEFGIKEKVAFFDLDVNCLKSHAAIIKKYIPISKYPPIIEDLSFIVPPRKTVIEIEENIMVNSPLIKKVELIDVFENTRTFRLTYQSAEKSLTDKEIAEIREKIIKNLEKQGVVLKGKL